ncbi:Acyl-CoA synthetase (AMP-forming)/AMP-acid ligase II-like protein [Kribbella flavida DSM 17836]|uniref:Acyl-CoA synthetase (AMP-forming)/AMP-acid ligase II-like protein n=1 Tax=Kribbella flavida (strain DSM 17836 / JCM 10339 / NBRC 14399) TaxID=479435 RepID=D2PVY4_KRIFD|nr:class I adenylate-forming enzyme family protein [Kribbella flavida]ADB29641.1 Acyl-CoA synthetase (AMP-forming)/AMP-acid ligase II-like protein [Kribbella flavida DSM 17836]
MTAPRRTTALIGDDNRVVVGGKTLTWRTLHKLPQLPSPAAVLVDNGADALAAVRHHAVHGTELLVATSSRVDLAMREELGESGFAVVLANGDEHSVTPAKLKRVEESGRVWLLTSGSTGRPKRIGHTLESLTTVRGQQQPRTWLVPYSPGTYAWWQVITISLTQADQNLVVIEPSELETWPLIAAEHGVTAASGTPTFWRQTIYRDTEALAKVPLEQITLGGEPVDQAILDRLKEIFPNARVSWIYASSEVGASIVVHDGQAGFPKAWLNRDPDPASERPVLSVDGDELVIASPHHGAGLEGAHRTGDRVEFVGDRVLITGRLDTDEINVGGSKVSAGLVRNVLMAHPAVAWARVFARKAPLVGRMVAAEVVLNPDLGPVTDADLVQWCTNRLPDYGVPRRIRFLPEIPQKETLKSDV